MATPPPPGRREAKKAATRRALVEAAMALFAEHGYQATTIEQVAAAAGVSQMTFFRYFPAKDHLVLTSEHDAALAQRIAARPHHESGVAMVRAAITESLTAIYPQARDQLLQRWTLVDATPELLALQAQRATTTQHLITQGLATHPGHHADSLRTQVTAATCLAAATTAALTWARAGGATSLIDITHDAFDTLTTLG